MIGVEEGGSRYGARGASASKEDVHRAISGLDKGLFPSAFCKVLPDVLGGDAEYCNLIHADGAGTKSALAYLYWRETGDTEVWKGIARDSVVMNLDDLCCAGATGPFLLSSTLGRNKHRIPGEVLTALIQGTEEYLAELDRWGVKVVSGGGETADLGDLIQTVVVDSTMTARMPRKGVIANNRISVGDAVVGFASYGVCAYEKTPNSGIGSNGLTSARHDLLDGIYRDKYPETMDTRIPKDLCYSGRLSLTEDLNTLLVRELTLPADPLMEGLDFGRWFLSPTRTYAPLIQSMLVDLGVERIHGMIHCSGGGQTKVMHFVGHATVVKDNLLPVPPLFELIQRQSGTTWQEMYRVFNMGHRLEVYLPMELAEIALQWGKHWGLESTVVGRVVDGPGGLQIQGPEGWLTYGTHLA
jgi:phosphoribosylformylglycinamidine cyclo-ligase